MTLERYLNRDTPFANCERTSIQSPLLEAIVANKKRTINSTLNPITNGGHGRSNEARHLLTYILRSALHIYRLPGHSDLEPDPKFFHQYKAKDIEEAIQDARRIYDFGQDEMRKINKTIRLSRGLRLPESSVAYTLAKEVGFPIHLPFQTIAFFNHVTSPFDGEATLRLDAPIEWIWASEYTLDDLAISSTDEEVIVVVNSIDGCIDVSSELIEFSSSAQLLELKGEKDVYLECLGTLFSGKKLNTEVSVEYKPGFFEGFGRKLDRRFSNTGVAIARR